MINFMAEISDRSKIAVSPTPSDDFTRDNNIYYIDINEHPENTYWTDWGGHYDTFSDTQIEVYYGVFLKRVGSVNELLQTQNSLYITEDLLALINIPAHPWLYPDYQISASCLAMFLSAPLSADNPSGNFIRNKYVQIRMEIPSINNKLSGSISGIIFNQSFSLSFKNNDGYFDDEERWNLFNTPVYLKKTNRNNPRYGDFKTIRAGFVEETAAGFSSFNIKIIDKIRAMEEPACEIITQEKYEGIVIDSKSLGKNIPVVYGQKKIKLTGLDATKYVAAEYVSQIIGIYNKDGAIINSWAFDGETGVITVPGGNAETAVVKGYENNKLGEIIIDIISRKTDIVFSESEWAVKETAEYAEASPRLNFLIEEGSVKDAVNNALKSDIAYLIQRNDGKLTVRKYGNIYRKHVLPPWLITKPPEKDFAKARINYFSACVINYNFTDKDNKYSLYYNEKEHEAEELYRKKTNKTFDTDLVYEQDAYSLAEILSERYLYMRHTLKLSLGADTSECELLDTVIIPVEINGRKFTNANKYIIVENNAAQDILALEEIKKDEYIEIDGMDAGYNNYDITYDSLGAADTEFEIKIDGGSNGN